MDAIKNLLARVRQFLSDREEAVVDAALALIVIIVLASVSCNAHAAAPDAKRVTFRIEGGQLVLYSADTPRGVCKAPAMAAEFVSDSGPAGSVGGCWIQTQFGVQAVFFDGDVAQIPTHRLTEGVRQ